MPIHLFVHSPQQPDGQQEGQLLTLAIGRVLHRPASLELLSVKVTASGVLPVRHHLDEQLQPAFQKSCHCSKWEAGLLVSQPAVQQHTEILKHRFNYSMLKGCGKSINHHIFLLVDKGMSNIWQLMTVQNCFPEVDHKIMQCTTANTQMAHEQRQG